MYPTNRHGPVDNIIMVKDIFGKSLKPSNVAKYSKEALMYPRNAYTINKTIFDIIGGKQFTFV